jgi:hypothetical protein
MSESHSDPPGASPPESPAPSVQSAPLAPAAPPPLESPAKDEAAASKAQSTIEPPLSAQAATPVEILPKSAADSVIEAAPRWVPAAPAVLAGSDGRTPLAEPSPPIPTLQEAAAFSFWRRRPTPIALRVRVGLAFFLVAFGGFVMGRLTAPTPTAPSQPLARSAAPFMEMTSVATAAMLAPVPPALTTAPSSTAAAQAAMPGGPSGLEPAEKPLAAAALPSVPQAAYAPSVQPDSQPTRRIGAAGARSVTPIPSATMRVVNPFVQAVHDDIAEDDALHKKR